MIRNRQSAALSRKRKADRIDSLIQRVTELEEENHRLRLRVGSAEQHPGGPHFAVPGDTRHVANEHPDRYAVTSGVGGGAFDGYRCQPPPCSSMGALENTVASAIRDPSPPLSSHYHGAPLPSHPPPPPLQSANSYASSFSPPPVPAVGEAPPLVAGGFYRGL